MILLLLLPIEEFTRFVPKKCIQTNNDRVRRRIRLRNDPFTSIR
jgi:hypothetical protein